MASVSLRAFAAFSVFGLFLSGCGQKPAVPIASSSGTPAPILKPLPSAAMAHPAPGTASSVNLDQAETKAAQHPEDVNAQRDAAFCYYRLQAYAQAVPAFQKVIVLAQNSISDRLYLGYAQMAVGTLDDAIATFLSVSEAKGVSSADMSSAYLQIGSCDLALQRDDQAAEAFARSLSADPHQGEASLGLGIYDAEKGKRDAARTAFTNAARDLPVGPQRAQAYACLGRLAEEGKDDAGAMTAYRQALALDAKNAWARRAMARLKGTAKG